MASVNVCMMCGSDPVNGECPECGGVRPLVTRAARADMILPRDCDGGLVDLAAEAAGYDPDERIGIADDEQDNAAMISRDLAALAFRVLSMPITDDFGINEKAVLAEMIRKAERYADGR